MVCHGAIGRSMINGVAVVTVKEMTVSRGQPAPGHPSDPVLRAMRYLHEHLAQPVTVAELAGVAGLSPYHFLRVFKRAAGHPPHRYLTLLRIAEVKRQLAGGATVTQAARRCGFYSTAHLSAVFLHETGVRPSRWPPPRDQHPDGGTDHGADHGTDGGVSDRGPSGRRPAVR